VIEWAAIGVAALACQRWWHWKREAYRTRDAAFKAFDDMKRAALKGDE
jgi:hypothetical protein